MAAAKSRPRPRPGVLDIAPYVPGTSALPGAHPVIKLSSNETPFGPSPRAVEAFLASAQFLSRYPDGSARPLREALAKLYGLDPDHIVCGAGSDELLNLLATAYLGPGDEAIYSEHGFLVYKIAILARGATPVAAPETNLTADVDAILARVSPATRVIFIANPNNPTGTLVRQDAIDAFMARVPNEVVVAFDEAYFEYLDDPPDTLQFVRGNRNVIVLRTFSKIHALANARLGYGMARPELIRVLQKTREPFNTNGLAQAGAVAALADVAHQAETKRVTDEGRNYLESEFAALRLPYVASVANFVLVRVGDGKALFKNLLRKGVIVRALSGYPLPEWVRISVGTMEQNRKCIAALREVLAA